MSEDKQLTEQQQGQIEGPASEAEAIEFMTEHGGGIKILVVPPGQKADKAFYVACLFGERKGWINTEETLKVLRDVMIKMVGDVLVSAARQQQDALFTDDHFETGFKHHPDHSMLGHLAANALAQRQAERGEANRDESDDEVAHV